MPTDRGVAADATATAVTFGGSAEAIRHHYDVGNEFYALWLDDSLTYSAALWSGGSETSLASAQRAKLDYHLDNVGLPEGGRLLDVGCGWGALLRRACERTGLSRAVGLTLSEEQARHVTALRDPRIAVRTENWADHEPDGRYHGIVSIGAFEHFAHPRQSAEERLRVYRGFFERCRQWLEPGGALSLQTIVYGDMDADDANSFIMTEIFPDAELPRPHEIFAATDRLFEIVTYRNDRLDYARTCEAWLANLRRRRAEALAVAGEETVARYERYLMLSAMGFRLGRIGLTRLKLVPCRGGRGAGK
jgi:cyclopropane-fatty-acyl-phospholipid synthase